MLEYYFCHGHVDKIKSAPSYNWAGLTFGQQLMLCYIPTCMVCWCDRDTDSWFTNGCAIMVALASTCGKNYAGFPHCIYPPAGPNCLHRQSVQYHVGYWIRRYIFFMNLYLWLTWTAPSSLIVVSLWCSAVLLDNNTRPALEGTMMIWIIWIDIIIDIFKTMFWCERIVSAAYIVYHSRQHHIYYDVLLFHMPYAS